MAFFELPTALPSKALRGERSIVRLLIALIEIDIIGCAYEKKGFKSCHRHLRVGHRQHGDPPRPEAGQ
jgi:hypothetical protein